MTPVRRTLPSWLRAPSRDRRDPGPVAPRLPYDLGDEPPLTTDDWHELMAGADFDDVVRAGHPRFGVALRADVAAALRYRNEDRRLRGRLDVAVQALRLAATSDSFLAQCCYRAKARAQSRGIPVLPHVFHRLAIALGQVCIGDPVHVEPGLYLPHGQVVIDGITFIGPGTVVSPFSTIGLKAGQPFGPYLVRGVQVGTGARVLGPVQIGACAVIGANAVVIHDVAADTTVVGAPARPIGTP